jgi:hypothetical protein
VRHVRGFDLHHVEVSYDKEDRRPPFVLDDVVGASFDSVKGAHAEGVSTLVLRKVKDLALHNWGGRPDVHRESVENESF